MAEQIVVGYDGSEHSDRALDWAIQEAAALSAELKVVVSTGRPVAVDPSLYGTFLETIDEEGAGVAAQAVARAGERGVPAEAVVERGDAAGVLVDASETASALVLGKRGRHGVRGRVGSVSAAAAAHAKCPVIVLPDRWNPEHRRAGEFAGHVVVGLDKLGAESPAVPAAVRYAQRHELRLALITVAPDITTVSTAAAELDHPVRVELGKPSEAMVDQVADALRAEHPGLQVTTFLRFGRPADELIEASRSAELAVVGSRGYGGFRGLLMGSVSQAVLNDGECPVMIVPARKED